jgi:ribosomal protein L40E
MNDFEKSKEEEWICSKCGVSVAEDASICPKCGADVSEIEDEDGSINSINQPRKYKNNKPTRHSKSDKYRYLKIASTICKALAYLSVIAAILGTIWGFVLFFSPNSLSPRFGLTIILYSIIGGFLNFIFWMAVSELIMLFIDIELNTRTRK